MEKNEEPKIALRSIGSLFSDAWALYKERWSVLVEIVLLPTLIVLLGAVIIALDLGSLSRVIGELVVFVGWVTFVYSVLPIVYSIHHGAGVDASYKATIGWFWPYVWLVILEILAVMGGFVMLIIPGIWLSIALSFAVYTFVIEHRRGIDALRASKAYVKGYWWAILGRGLLLAIIYIVPMLIVQIPAALLGGRILTGIVAAVIVLFFVPFSAIYHYIIFKNLRELKPALAEEQTKEGTGFIKASAIVGLVTPIVLIFLCIVIAGAGIFYMMRHADFRSMPSPGYGPGYGAQIPPSRY